MVLSVYILGLLSSVFRKLLTSYGGLKAFTPSIWFFFFFFS